MFYYQRDEVRYFLTFFRTGLLMYQELLLLELVFLKFERDVCVSLAEVDFRLAQRIGDISDRIEVLASLTSRISSSDIEKILGASYRCRIEYWDRIMGTSCRLMLDFAEPLIDLNGTLDALIIETNLRGKLELPKYERFTRQLDEIKTALHHKTAAYVASPEWLAVGQPHAVQLFFGDLFQRALYLQKRIIFLQSWRDFLGRKAKRSAVLGHSEILQALADKKLLIAARKQFFLSFYKAVGDRPRAALARNILAARHAGIMEPGLLVDKLAQSLSKLQQEISTLEPGLKKHDWLTEITASGMYLWSESYYFKFAEIYFTFLNDMDEGSSLASIPVLGVKLTDNYLSFFTTLGSVLLLGVDSRFIGVAGTSCGLLATLTQFLLSDLESIAGHVHGIIDEKQLAEAMPYVEQLLGFGLNVILYSALFGINAGTIGMLTAGFLAASACRKLVGETLDWMHGKDHSQDKGWNLWVKQPVQHVASIAAYYFAAKTSSRFFRPALSKEQLLSDETYCLQESKRCRKEALAFLGLPETASTYDAVKVFRKLALKRHPDRTLTTEATQMVKLTQVKELLEKLEEGGKAGRNTP